jgi:UDP-2,3-diacylglucosamine pyrophosphatase LpxH
VRVLSDLHLGNKVSRIDAVEALRPLVRGAGTVVFNGDTWQELAREWKDDSAKMLAELRTLCAEEGSEPVFLSGNHDPGWPGPGWLELAGGRVLVTHGDALFHDSSPWKHEIMKDPEAINRLWDACPDAGENPEARLRVAREIARSLPTRRHATGRAMWQRALDGVLPPQRGLRMLEAWLTQGTAGAAFCERYFPRVEVLVIGHFHWQGSWFRGGRRVINTGSFVNPGRAQYVELEDGWLKRGRIHETPQRCELGETLEVWRL